MASDNSRSSRFRMIVCPYPFIVRDATILLARRKNTSYMPGMYSLPAGHQEPGERLTDCLIREVKEEAGLTIAREDLKFVHCMQRFESDIRTDVFFEVKRWVGEPRVCEPELSDDIGWFPFHCLPGNTVPYIRAAIEAWRKGEVYQEWGIGDRHAPCKY